MPCSERLIKALLLFILIGTLYAPTGDFNFVYDDLPHITLNPQVTDQSLSWLSVFSQPTHPGDLYRPVTTLTYRATYALVGLDPKFFHFTNIILHWMCAVLIGAILWTLTNQCNPAFLTAALFALHPLGTETVASVVGRAELLSALCILAALYVELQRVPRARSLRTVLLTLPLLLCGMLSKESAFVGVGLLPTAVYWASRRAHEPLSESRRKTTRIFLVTLASAIVALILRVHALGGISLIQCTATRIFPENPICHLPLGERALPALYLLGQYAFHALLPLSLSTDYSQALPTLLSVALSPLGFLQALLVPILLLAAWRHRQSVRGAGIFWFFIAFSCTANLLFPIGTLMADRLTYLPLAGALASISYLLVGTDPARQWPRAGAAVSVLLLIMFACVATARVTVWRDSYSLFSSAVRDNPLSPKAHYNLAITYLLERKDPSRAEAHLKESLRLHPDDARTTRALAEIGISRNEPWRAEYWLRRTLELDPGDTKSATTLQRLQELKQ